MATIKSITASMYNNKPDGGFNVVITDGNKEVVGSIGKKDTKSDKGLQVGDEVTYSENPWTSGKGTVVNFLTITKVASGVSGQSSQSTPQQGNALSSGQDIKSLKVNACVNAMHDAVSAFNSERIPWEKVTAAQRELAEQLVSEIDDIFSGKI